MKRNTRNFQDTMPIETAFALAATAFRMYVFVRRNHGYYDEVAGKHVHDTKTLILSHYRGVTDDSIAPLDVTDEDRARGLEIIDFFKQKVIMIKLTDELDGFDKQIADIVLKDKINENVDLSVVASLPNSYEIEKVRERMDRFFHEHRHVSEFVGETGSRLKLEVQVQDVKWIPKRSCFLVTATTDERCIVKFFLKDADADLSAAIRDRRITFVGTVRNQQVSEYTHCHETLFNRVKVLES